jgi:hypothetical protein
VHNVAQVDHDNDVHVAQEGIILPEDGSSGKGYSSQDELDRHNSVLGFAMLDVLDDTS